MIARSFLVRYRLTWIYSVTSLAIGLVLQLTIKGGF